MMNGQPMVEYEDGLEMPRGGIPTRLPPVRMISNRMMAVELGPAEQRDRKLSGQHFAYGQLLTHDFIETETIPGFRGPNCCNPDEPDFNNTDVCFPLEVPVNDTSLTPPCDNFIRAVAAKDTVYREQLNDVTSYIDGNTVYGNSKEDVEGLRVTDSYLMKTGPGDVLPESGGFCRPRIADVPCQRAGDGRVNQVPSLGLNHLIFVREHNRIASDLRNLRPDWNNETVFQETRRIVIAEVQQITFCEYLPAMLSDKILKQYNLNCKNSGYSDSYQPLTDASVRNAFAVAPFRMGHSQAMREQSLLKDDYTTKNVELLVDNFFDTFITVAEMGKFVGDLGRWLTYSPADRVDQFGVNAMRNTLFGNEADLLSINLQRGRDQGTPGYNKWREFCGLPRKEFEDFGENSALLMELYESVDDIDLFLAGLLEPHHEGCSVGETFAHLIARQFQLTKVGDRYYYERDDPNIGFREDQLNSIKRMTMSKLMCQNLDIAEIQLKAFENPYGRETLQPCSTLPDIDFNLWRKDRYTKEKDKSYTKSHNNDIQIKIKLDNDKYKK